MEAPVMAGRGQGMAQSRRERLDRQRERQRGYRADMKAKSKPSRDDIARTLLYWAITEALDRDGEKGLFRVQDRIVGELVAQGFDKKASDSAFHDLIDKYRSGWTFRRKVHLQPNGDDQGEGG